MTETPMMKQYLQIKESHQDEILFFRMGDFYEMFFDDAELASRELGIVLTSRNKGINAIPMAGIPAKALDSYLPKLLQKGFKVAICEQVEDAAQAQGLVDRDVVRIITPGTLTEQEVLDEKRNNFLLALNPGKNSYGLAWVDISTGQFSIHEIKPEFIGDEIARISPAECLIPEHASLRASLSNGENSLEETIRQQDIAVTLRQDWFFETESAVRSLTEHLQVQTLEGYGCNSMNQALGAAGALLRYLHETQRGQVGSFDHIDVYDSGETMFLDRATRNCLEIQKTMRESNRRGTLFSVIDHTRTAMGARLLTDWLSAPLIVPEKIRARQSGIHDLVAHPEILARIRDDLASVQDIERLCARIAYQRANARDLLALKISLQVIPRLYQLLEPLSVLILQQLRRQFTEIDSLTELLDAAIHLDPKNTLKEGDIIKPGYNRELDELRDLQQSGDAWLKSFEAHEIERTNIYSLKVGYNKVFGYYIEVTNAHAHKIPGDYLRKQTLKNAERYITAELKEYEGKVLSASEKSKALEYELFVGIRDQVARDVPRLRRIAVAVATLDVLAGLAKLARQNHYVCPEIDTSKEIDIEQGRHPVLEVTLADSFVANDLYLRPGQEMIIITGPNMAGKSTYIRQAALMVLLAQIGSFLPAKRVRIGVVDRIFTRIGAGDEIARGQSTFMVEMVETANILNNASERSFIALDEIGRGTSTFDGISLAWAIMEHIQQKIGARTLFATHYHEMAELAQVSNNIRNYNVAVQEWGEEIAFLYKIVEGSADKSYGLHVARLAGIPKQIIKRGKAIMANLEKHAVDFQSYTRRCCKIKSANGQVEDNLFTLVGEEIIDGLAHLDLNELTPLEALEILKELQNEARQI